MDIIEVLRWFVVINGAFLMFQALQVAAVYSSVYSLSPNDWRKQLPLHVWLMAFSFFMYVAGTSYYLIIAGGNVVGRLCVYGIAGVIAQYGLWNVLKYDRRRYSKVTNFQDPHIEP